MDIILKQVSEIRARLLIAIAGSETQEEIDRVSAPFYAEIYALINHKPVVVPYEWWKVRTDITDF